MTEQEIEGEADRIVVTGVQDTTTAAEVSCVENCRLFLRDKHLRYSDIHGFSLQKALNSSDGPSFVRRIGLVEKAFIAAIRPRTYRSIEIRNRLRPGGISATSTVSDLVSEMTGGVA